jgi:hypothetical protein
MAMEYTSLKNKKRTKLAILANLQRWGIVFGGCTRAAQAALG